MMEIFLALSRSVLVLRFLLEISYLMSQISVFLMQNCTGPFSSKQGVCREALMQNFHGERHFGLAIVLPIGEILL